MATVAVLNVAVKATTKQFFNALNNSGKKVDTFAARTGRAFRRISIAAKGATLAVSGLGALSFVGLVVGLRRVSSELDRVAKTARRLGIASQELMAIQFAAEQTGVEERTLNLALQRMTRRIAEAAKGLGEARVAIRELGLDARHLVRLPLEEQFAVIADRLNRVTIQAERVRLGFKLFDSEGVALVNTLKLGSSGLRDMRAEAERLGLLFTDEQLRNVEQMNDALNRLERSAKSAIERLVIALAVPITETIEGFDQLLEFRKRRDELESLIRKRDAPGLFGLSQLKLPLTSEDEARLTELLTQARKGFFARSPDRPVPQTGRQKSFQEPRTLLERFFRPGSFRDAADDVFDRMGGALESGIGRLQLAVDDFVTQDPFRTVTENVEGNLGFMVENFKKFGRDLAGDPFFDPTKLKLPFEGLVEGVRNLFGTITQAQPSATPAFEKGTFEALRAIEQARSGESDVDKRQLAELQKIRGGIGKLIGKFGEFEGLAPAGV